MLTYHLSLHDALPIYATFLKMNASGTIFVAALNGSALAVGAELAFACDLRIMADGDYVIGLTEVLLALTPGGGGSQRLDRKSTRLNSSHRCISYAVFC